MGGEGREWERRGGNGGEGMEGRGKQGKGKGGKKRKEWEEGRDEKFKTYQKIKHKSLLPNHRSHTHTPLLEIGRLYFG